MVARIWANQTTRRLPQQATCRLILKKKIRVDDLQIKKNNGPLVQACQGRPERWTQQNGPSSAWPLLFFFSNSFFKLMIFYGFFSNFFNLYSN
jgi:hypothetical protein